MGSGEIALVYRPPQICGLTKRRVAYARRTEGDRLGSVKATLPEHQYRDREEVASLQTNRIKVGGTLVFRHSSNDGLRWVAWVPARRDLPVLNRSPTRASFCLPMPPIKSRVSEH